MRIGRSALLLGTSLLPLPALAQATTPPATASAQVRPIAYTERTLPNGLKLYAIRDTSTANVAVQVWYDVGSKADPRGRSGFSHMFEHLMFKATRNLVAEQMDRLTEDVGGYNNASNADDYTNYYQVVPANHLERILFAEADRMGSLVLDPAVFASERDVVKEELRSRVLAQPYGKLFYLYLPMVSYTHHPYARPGIGSIEDLDAATIEDARAFHATWYRPDNAVLVVAGNFDPAQLDRWVDQYFGKIARPDRAIPTIKVDEPRRTRATRHTVYEPNTPLPAVLMSFQAPSDDHPDAAALAVLEAILSRGDNSRLYQSLVYRDQLAVQASTFVSDAQGPGAFALYAILSGGKSAADGEAAMRRELARLRDEPVTADELAEARNELLTAAIGSRETAEGRALALARGVIVLDNPRAADERLAAIGRVTAADIQRVARAYLRDDGSATVHYLPAEAKPAGATGDTIAVPATVVTQPLVAPPNIVVHTSASAADRILPPAPGAPVDVRLPTPVEFKLDNGMRVVVVEKRDVPMVSATIIAPGGAAHDPAGRTGTAALAADLLTKGTKTRSATQIAAAIERLGGSIGSGAGPDSTAISLGVKSDQLAPALDLLADVARNPTFAAEELERARAQSIDGVSVQMKDPAALASMVATRATFGAGPYGGVTTPTALRAVTRDDVAAVHARDWRPERLTLVLVGDIDQATARAQANRLFADWRPAAAAAAPPQTAPAPAAAAPRVVVVDLPGAGQAGVVLSRPAITRADPKFHATAVANAVLGVGFTSRLNQEIRIKRGLAYGAGSGVDARRMTGPFTARTQTKNESAAEVVALIRAEIDRLAKEPVPAAELATRKAVLTGGFGRSVETSSGIASILADYATDGVALSELQTYMATIEGVTPAAAQAAAAQVMTGDGASIVIVGDAKLFIDELRKAYPNAEVIPIGELNLDSAKLR